MSAQSIGHADYDVKTLLPYNLASLFSRTQSLLALGEKRNLKLLQQQQLPLCSTTQSVLVVWLHLLNTFTFQTVRLSE